MNNSNFKKVNCTRFCKLYKYKQIFYLKKYIIETKLQLIKFYFEI